MQILYKYIYDPEFTDIIYNSFGEKILQNEKTRKMLTVF